MSNSASRQKLGVHVISSAEGGAGHADAIKGEEPSSDNDTRLPAPQDTLEVCPLMVACFNLSCYSIRRLLKVG